MKKIFNKKTIGAALVTAGALSMAFGTVGVEKQGEMVSISVTVGTEKPPVKQAALLGGFAILGAGLAVQNGWKFPRLKDF